MVRTRLNVEVVRLVGCALVLDDALIELAAIIHGACLSFVIYSDKTEASRLTLAPLEVVKEAPMIISLDMVIGLAYQLKLVVYEQWAEGIVIVARAVLGNEDGG